nr:MAG: hypothetical protein [Marnaviridae sp.]
MHHAQGNTANSCLWSMMNRRLLHPHDPPSLNSLPFITKDNDEIFVYVESAMTLLYDLKRSTTVTGVTISMCSFFRSVTQTSATGTLLNIFVKLAEELQEELPFFQSSLWIDTLDDFHRNIGRVRDSVLGRKLITVLNHVVAHSVYHKLNIRVDAKLFHKMEQGFTTTVWDVATFADALSGLLIFLLKAGRQAMLTGSSEPFFVDSARVSDWLLVANRLRKDAEFLGNPDAVDLSVPIYLKKIADTIDDGKRLAKVFDEQQRILINNVILELELVQKRYISTLCAASFRFRPVGIFLYGDSGVGKSFLVKGLFYHYCSVRGIPKEDATLYPRNPDERFWSGYKSSYTGVVVDDIGKHKSNKVMGIDTSISEIISIGNNTPFVTDQAELADKGKVPMLVEWMGLTSNLVDFGVHDYYNNTYAVLSRAELRIEPIVKSKYRLGNTTKLDPSKVPAGMYPDCWRFEVCRVVRNDADHLHGSYQVRGTGVTYESYSELLQFLSAHYQHHIDNQLRLLRTVDSMGPEELCVCRLPISLCNCGEESDIINDHPTPDIIAPIAQALDENRVAYITKAVALRKKLIIDHQSLVGLDKLYFNKWLKEDFDPSLAAPIEGNPEISELADMLVKDVLLFQQLPIQQKLREVVENNEVLNRHNTSDYLSFVPTISGPRNVLRQQLKWVYDYILECIDIMEWSDQKKATLELFVYEEAASMLAEGWDDPSIVQAALDYVDAYHTAFTVPITQEYEGFDELSIKERVMRYLGIQYFTRPWLYKTSNWFMDTRFGKYVIDKCSRKHQAQILVALGEVYDTRLFGKHTFIRIVVAVCSSAAFVTIFTMLVKYFAVNRETKSQLSLEAIGIKPKRREEEKKNVWCVSERNITALDFHPKRPNRLSQLMPAVERNSVYVEMTSPGIGKARTRALVINNNTILVNSHSCFEKFTLVIYLGSKSVEGICPTVTFEVCEDMISRVPERDLAIITTLALPALFKDLERYFFVNQQAESVGPSFYSIPQENGERSEIDVYGVTRQQMNGFVGARSGINMKALVGKSSTPTVAGECGSPLIIVTAHGPIIAGIHCAYNAHLGVTHAAPIYATDFKFGPMVQIGKVEPAAPIAQNDKTTKLYSDYHQAGTLITFGALRGFRPRPKANGGHSSIATFCLREGPKRGLPIVDRLTTPDMGSWEPQQNILKEYLSPTHSIHEPMFKLCVDSFVEHITNGLTSEDIEDVHVVTVAVAVNGYPGIPNVDAQKFTTSAGHGFPGPKKAYVDYDGEYEEWSRFRTYNKDVMDEVERIYELAKLGIRSHPVFTAQLKDEMISLAKRAAKKTRGFYMCPLAFLTLMRMFTTGLTRIMVRRRKLFRNAVGLNTHSEEWADLLGEANKIPGDNWMAGDFKGFDKILNILIQNGAKQVILDVAKFCGFNDEELLVLDVLLCDNVTAVIDFFGELVMLLGGEVSGHQLTTFFNCLCNILLHMYAWTVLAKEQGFEPREAVHRFWKLVFICVLGDDIMAKVHPDATWYNHTTVQRVFGNIGIEYTMADKLSESVPYISYKDVTFLKRRFDTHPLFPGLAVAPLERESIYKMLVYTIPSRTVSSEEQLAMAATSAVAESFYHGKEFFDKITSLIKDAPKTPEQQARMEQFPIPSWVEMYERFLSASPTFKASLASLASAETTPTPTDIDCQLQLPQAQCDWSVDPWGSTTYGRSPKSSFQSRSWLSSNKFAKQREIEISPTVYNIHLSKNYKKQTKQTPPPQEGQMTSVAVEKVINKLAKKNYQKKKSQQWEARAQADIRPDTEGAVTVTQQTYQFKNEATSKTVDLSAKRMATASRMTMPQTLGDYFARPKLIHTFTWTEAMSYGVNSSIAPWNLFLTDPSFVEKMGGFGLFRGNLHLKFTVNGSPFYYGGLMAAYTPLSGYRSDTAVGSTNQVLVCASQKPHVWLNVQNISSADLILPFLAPYPFADTTAATYTALGRLDFIIYKALQSANGVTGSAVDIQVFAWIEDIELAGPTNQPVSQADIEYEKDRTISSTASTVAGVAGALSGVPVIGPYAAATSEMASMLGKTAELFGFTNVPNISDVNPMMQVPFNLASTQISSPLTKLSLQPKQEIALGSVQHGGMAPDDLVMKRFLQRESFLVGSNWTTSHTPGTIEFTTGVSPQLWQTNGTTQLAFPPMGYLSQVFQYWRGSVEFTVKVIRSKYHRGRLLLSWDRNSTNLNQGPTLGNTNTFSTVLDLDESDEVTFSVPYIQAKQFLGTYTIANPLATLPWSTSGAPATALAPGFYNGVFNIRVLNRLTAPESSSDVELLIFVKGGEDLEMAAPRNLSSPTLANGLQLSPLTTSVAQSDITYEEDHVLTRHQDPEVNPIVYQEVFGEQVVSLRDLLHRSALAKSYSLPTPIDGMLKFIVPLKHMPVSPGIFNNGIETTTAPVGTRANICPQHLIPWISACFVGFKGSVNVTANVRMTSLAPNAGYVDHLTIDRVPDGRTLNAAARTPNSSVLSLAATANVAAVANNTIRPGLSGKALTNTRTNTSISANLPYYNNSGFYVADLSKTYNNTDTYSGSENDWWELVVQTPTLGAMGQGSAVDVYYGTGPDFDLIFFLNTPIVYYATYSF